VLIFTSVNVGFSAAFALIDAANGVAPLAARIWPSVMGFIAVISACVLAVLLDAKQRRMTND